jgi:adenylate kinase family enzyme
MTRMTDALDNPLIYLFAYPGAGKNTIARALENHTDYLAIQNHFLSNALRRAISLQPPEDYAKIEPALKHHTMKSWLNFLEFVTVAVPQQGLILTSVLYENDPDKVEFFELVRKWANDQGRKFLPVRLVCSPEEMMRRLESPSRDTQYKLTDRHVLQKLMTENNLLNPADGFELDVTALSPNEAAEKIVTELSLR